MGKVYPFTHFPQDHKETGIAPAKPIKSSVRQTAAGAAVNTILVLKQVDTSLYMRIRNTTLPPRESSTGMRQVFLENQSPSVR